MTIQRAFRSSTPLITVVIALVLVATLCNASAQTPAKPATTATPPTRVRARLEGFDISPQAGHSANQGGGSSRGGSAPKLYAPVLGKAYSVHPQFEWQAFNPDAKVTFHLMTPDGITVFEAPASGGHFDYPPDAPALTPGSTYRWTVIPADEDLYAGLPTPVGFLIVPETERAAIAAELAALKDPAAAAEVYVKHRLWYDAIQAYTALLDRNPGNTTARAARAQLYDQLVVTKALADADWAKVH